LAAVVMAADHRPVVTVKNSSNFKIMIDGRSYFGNDGSIFLDRMNNGYHTIQVFEMRRVGFMGRRERMVDATTFLLGRNDVAIRIDHFGQIAIRERRNFNSWGNNNNDWGRDDRDIRDDRNWDNDHRYDRRDDRYNRF